MANKLVVRDGFVIHVVSDFFVPGNDCLTDHWQPIIVQKTGYQFRSKPNFGAQLRVHHLYDLK